MKSEHVEHGGPDLQELQSLGVDPSTLLDFSVCTNPFGPSGRVREALAQVSLDQYPDPQSHALRTALAAKYGISAERMLAGNGVSELIWLTALAFVKPNDQILVLAPTYGEYARAAALQRGTVISCRAQAIEAKLENVHPRLVFFCNPNNPTGNVLGSDVICSWIRQYRETLFVVDEAYSAFVPNFASLVTVQEPNLLVLRSMTKDYALAGLRIGYVVGNEIHLAELAQVRPPWSVNAFAEAAAVAALQDDQHLKQSLAKLQFAKQTFVAGLTELGLEVWPSATHFFLVRVGNASAFRLELLKKGILVRNAASFGLPGFVRLATRKPQDNARLLAVLREGF